MLQPLSDMPASVVAVRAVGEITKEDYEAVMLPIVERAVKENNEINFLMVLETDVQNFTPAAWMRDAWMSLKNYSKWNKVAVVTDQKFVEKLSDMLRYVFPGEAKGFSLDELQQAKEWVVSKT
jgi:hypothetical protein